MCEDRVSGIDDPVPITTVFWFVVFSKGNEAIGMIGLWLRGEIAEKFGSVINEAISIAIKRKKSVRGTSRRPSKVSNVTVRI